MATKDEKCPNCKLKLTKLVKASNGKGWKCGNCGAVLMGPFYGFGNMPVENETNETGPEDD